jgi:hypothetical protein
MLIGGGVVAAAALAVAVAVWVGHRPASSQRVDARRAVSSSRPATIRFEPPHDKPWPPIPDEAPKVGMLITGPEYVPGPQFGPQYAPGPQFGPSDSPREYYLQRMEREHGANRVVHIYIDGVAEGQKDALVARLKELSGASSHFVSGNKQSISVHLAPVRDLEGFAKTIDFGKVTSIDPTKRTIEVLVNSKKQ